MTFNYVNLAQQLEVIGHNITSQAILNNDTATLRDLKVECGDAMDYCLMVVQQRPDYDVWAEAFKRYIGNSRFNAMDKTGQYTKIVEEMSSESFDLKQYYMQVIVPAFDFPVQEGSREANDVMFDTLIDSSIQARRRLMHAVN